MPAISELTSQQLNTIRSGGYAGEVRIMINPHTVVFQTTVDETITNSPFIDFLWTGTLAGDYEDVIAGMTYFITETDDPVELRNPILRGRVARPLTSDTFYCNETAINLFSGYIVTVIAAFEPLQMDRSGSLVDGWLSFQNLPPAIKGVPSFNYVEDTVEGQFSFDAVMQVMAQGAIEDTYAWTIPDAVYDSGSSSTASITVTVPHGHRWCWLDVTDSNGVSSRLIFEILVCHRDDANFAFEAHSDVQINGDIDTGWNASVSYFAGVENLLNRTRVAIIAFDNYKSGSGTFPNVMFVGYLAQEETSITGDPVSSTLAETRFEIQSLAAIIGQLPVPSLAIRNAASPDAWDELTLPTPQRVIWHLISRYTTFGTLCAIDFVTTDATWFGGEMDLEATTLLESINRIAEEINAHLVFFPGGDAVLEINANFLSEADRNALPSLIASGNIEANDLFSYSLPLPYYDTVGQLECGFASFQSSGADVIKLAGVAPAVARQEGIESPVILAQLLPANLSQANAIAAGKQRIGDMLEWLNPPTLINFALTDAWRFATPSTRVWWNFDLPASDSTRGLPVPDTDRYLLQSISLTWHNNGTWDISGTARLETQGGLAQVNVAIAPNVINTDLPVLPILSDYDAYAPDGTLNYTSTDPGDDAQPYSPYDLVQFSPMTTEDAANAADNMPGASCQIIRPAVNFSSSETRLTTRPTVNGTPYVITVKGSARIAESVWQEVDNFTQETFDWLIITPNGNYTPTVGFTQAQFSSAGIFYTGVQIQYVFDAPATVTAVQMKANMASAGGSLGSQMVIARFLGGVPVDVIDTVGAYGDNLQLTQTDTVVCDEIQVFAYCSRDASGYVAGTVELFQVSATGTGTNPFTGEAAAEQFGDAFYTWQAGGAAELYPVGGLLINSDPPDVPPEYNDNHEYTLVYTGDGNQIPFLYFLNDYTNAQNLPLYVRVCGLQMGT
jgi:hypothetical protein